MTEEPFEALINRVRAGDERAATDLVRRYEPEIRREVRFLLRDPFLRRTFDSMDICQSVMGSFFTARGPGRIRPRQARRPHPPAHPHDAQQGRRRDPPAAGQVPRPPPGDEHRGGRGRVGHAVAQPGRRGPRDARGLPRPAQRRGAPARRPALARARSGSTSPARWAARPTPGGSSSPAPSPASRANWAWTGSTMSDLPSRRSSRLRRCAR